MKRTWSRGVRVYVVLFFLMFVVAMATAAVAGVRIVDSAERMERLREELASAREEAQKLREATDELTTVSVTTLRDARLPEELSFTMEQSECTPSGHSLCAELSRVSVTVGPCDAGDYCLRQDWLDAPEALGTEDAYDTYLMQRGMLDDNPFPCGGTAFWRFEFHPTAATFDTEDREWKASTYQAVFSVDWDYGFCDKPAITWTATNTID